MTSPTSPAAPSVLDQLPEDQRQFINGWSWGGFAFNCIFLIGMKQTLLGIGYLIVVWIPVVPIVAIVYLGLKGRAIAWKKRQWQGFDDFQKCMRIWDKWGIIIVAVMVGSFILAMVFAIVASMFAARQAT
ncbi:MAG: hypothetical protein FJX78_03380 [Armatimonadetes bacterium]|nr:hypothetical protein [Armatimonadota bacterium]